jgi:tRNA/tmRNA/rRNA uracil-C5-methylase (TrmA/RlmC/RlmD family)
VAADGFWQVHPGAADALVDAVRRLLAVRPGESVVDLYSGVGLFGLSLVGLRPGGPLAAPGRVTLVEGDRRACALARRNASAAPAGTVRVVCAPVDRWVARPGALRGVDVLVADPPRAGAGTAVARALAASGARAIAYVACDPVALARDAAALVGAGMRLAAIEAFDLFPTTHHVECVALFESMS